MTRRFAFVALSFALIWSSLTQAGGADKATNITMTVRFPLSDGSTLEGDPISFDARGMVVKKPDGTFAQRVGWTNFTQEALKVLSKEQPKAKSFIEPYLEIDEADAEKKPVLEIKPKALKRLERPDPKAGWGSLFSSPVTLALILLLWAGNIYAGWEVGIFFTFYGLCFASCSRFGSVIFLIGVFFFIFVILLGFPLGDKLFKKWGTRRRRDDLGRRTRHQRRRQNQLLLWFFF